MSSNIESDNFYKDNIKGIMNNRFLLTFNRLDFVYEGVYVSQISNLKDLTEKFNKDKFENKLKYGIKLKNGIRFSKDDKVRFAPKKNYGFGEHEKGTLAYDGFVIANYGIKGAEKLAEISREF